MPTMLDDVSGMGAPMGPFSSDLQYQIASPTVEKANGKKLSASVMQKMGKWKDQQKMGFEATKDHPKKEFLGLKDFVKMEDMKSKAHMIYMLCWNAIKSIAMKNLMVLATMVTDKVLGPVGKYITMIEGFSQIFTMDSDQAMDPAGVNSVVDMASGLSQNESVESVLSMPTAMPSFGG